MSNACTKGSGGAHLLGSESRQSDELDTLLDTVWPDTVVSPNTLQRSIAQLRKALGDDGKVQGYIQTHAKKGYSLECEVRWEGQTNELTNTEPQLEVMPAPEPEMQQDKHLTQSRNKHLYVFVLLAFTILLGAIGYQYFSTKKPSPLFFDTLRSLTATDDKEFDASYSPDGQYIVFHRYLNKFCDNKIWAKRRIPNKRSCSQSALEHTAGIVSQKMVSSCCFWPPTLVVANQLHKSAATTL